MKEKCLKTMLTASLVCGGMLCADDVIAVPAVLPGMLPEPEKKVEMFSWDMVPETIASVGDKTITKADLRKMIEAAGEIPADIQAAQIMGILYAQSDLLIRQAIVDAKLSAEGLESLNEISRKYLQTEMDSLSAEQRDALLKQLEDQGVTLDNFIAMVTSNPAMQIEMGIMALGTKYTAEMPAVTAEDCKKFYDENQDKFVRQPAVLEVSHILLQPDEKMNEEAVAKRINEIRPEVVGNPERFAEIAKAESKCPSGAQGGALGMQITSETGNLDPTFLAAALELEEGEVSPVVETNFGSHLILCTKKTPAVLESYTPELEKNLLKMLSLNRDFEAGAKAMEEYAKTLEITNNLPAPAFNPMMLMQ